MLHGSLGTGVERLFEQLSEGRASSVCGNDLKELLPLSLYIYVYMLSLLI